MNYYTGIGSRKTPSDVQERMEKIATVCRLEGIRLRSGGASGADQAFGRGAQQHATIYLPWHGFGQVESGAEIHCPNEFPSWVKQLAEQVHPAWKNVHPKFRAFHYRNVLQVLGHSDEVKLPLFLCCWTQDAKVTGGTATALRLAQWLHVPIVNLG